MLDKQDPYVYLSIGEEKARTETLNNAGAKPDWQGAELLIFVDEKNWNKPFKLDIYDDDFGSDSLIASHTLDLFNMMAENSAPYSSIPLLTGSGKEAGTFNCNCDFLPFGQLNVIVHSAKSLRNPDSWGKVRWLRLRIYHIASIHTIILTHQPPSPPPTPPPPFAA